MTQALPSPGRLQSIDMLRGVAALAVVAMHIPSWAPGGWREHPFFFLGLLFDYGYLGVPLFIVISGFCIHLGTARGRVATGDYRVNWLAYWSRRTYRLYPPYLAAIVFSLLVSWGLGEAVTRNGLFGVDLLAHLLMLHNLTAEYANGLGNGAFWSLGTEEHLYLLYLLLLPMVVRFGWARTLMLGFLISLAWRVLTAGAGTWVIIPDVLSLGGWQFWAFKFWFLWMLGALAVEHYLGLIRLPAPVRSGWTALGLLLLGFLCNRNLFDFLAQTSLRSLPVLSGQLSLLGVDVLVPLHALGELAFGLACFCLINYLSDGETNRGTARGGRLGVALASVGRASYSIYLTHVPVLMMLRHGMDIGFEPRDWLLRHVLGFALSIVVGYAFYMLIERWFQRRPQWLPR